MGFGKITKAFKKVAKAIPSPKKVGKAVAKGVEHVAKETAGETKKAVKAVGKGVEHAVIEFHEEYIECHGADQESLDSETTSAEKTGVILVISGSHVGCGVTVDNIDKGKKGECQDPQARDRNQCRNVFDVAFGEAGVDSVCQVAAGELWVSTTYKWRARHYGPSVTHKT